MPRPCRPSVDVLRDFFTAPLRQRTYVHLLYFLFILGPLSMLAHVVTCTAVLVCALTVPLLGLGLFGFFVCTYAVRCLGWVMFRVSNMWFPVPSPFRTPTQPKNEVLGSLWMWVAVGGVLPLWGCFVCSVIVTGIKIAAVGLMSPLLFAFNAKFSDVFHGWMGMAVLLAMLLGVATLWLTLSFVALAARAHPCLMAYVFGIRSFRTPAPVQTQQLPEVDDEECNKLMQFDSADKTPPAATLPEKDGWDTVYGNTDPYKRRLFWASSCLGFAAILAVFLMSGLCALVFFRFAEAERVTHTSIVTAPTSELVGAVVKSFPVPVQYKVITSEDADLKEIKYSLTSTAIGSCADDAQLFSVRVVDGKVDVRMVPGREVEALWVAATAELVIELPKDFEGDTLMVESTNTGITFGDHPRWEHMLGHFGHHGMGHHGMGHHGHHGMGPEGHMGPEGPGPHGPGMHGPGRHGEHGPDMRGPGMHGERGGPGMHGPGHHGRPEHGDERGEGGHGCHHVDPNPITQFKTIKLFSANGGIAVGNVGDAAEYIEIRSGNGNVRVGAMSAKKCVAATGNGGVFVGHSKCSYMSATTTNGPVTVGHAELGGEGAALVAKTVNGPVVLNAKMDPGAQQKLDVETDNGPLFIHALEFHGTSDVHVGTMHTKPRTHHDMMKHLLHGPHGEQEKHGKDFTGEEEPSTEVDVPVVDVAPTHYLYARTENGFVDIDCEGCIPLSKK